MKILALIIAISLISQVYAASNPAIARRTAYRAAYKKYSLQMKNSNRGEKVDIQVLRPIVRHSRRAQKVPVDVLIGSKDHPARTQSCFIVDFNVKQSRRPIVTEYAETFCEDLRVN
jgi:hypothetical protein